MKRVRRASLLALPLLLLGHTGRSQFPLGPEFRVNTYTTGNQAFGRAASDSMGNLVVVWQGATLDGSNYGVFGQRYSSSGTPLGGEFRVNTYTTSAQLRPQVASGSLGNFVVVWESHGDGSSYGIFGQRYASSGAPLGSEFRVNTYTSSYQILPSVAADAAGNFIVAWESRDQDGSGYGVFAQRYSSTGASLGSEFQASGSTLNDQSSASVASDSAGNFVVVWEDMGGDYSSFGIFGQRFESSGVSLSNPFQINTYTSGNQRFPSVSCSPSGNFVVVWQSILQDGSNYALQGRRYLNSGPVLAPEFRVNTFTTGGQRRPLVASDSAGGFVVVWQGSYQDGSGYGVFCQRYSSAGGRVGAEFRVNTTTASDQEYPAVATTPTGDFAVVWQSTGQDGSLKGIFAQHYCVQPLTAVSVSTAGSLTVCPGSTAGTAMVNDVGGEGGAHQWYYRTVPSGGYVPISGETGTTYLIKGNDFAGGASGAYYLFCLTTPSCGNQMFSSDNTIVISVTSSDTSAPIVTAPGALATPQTLCQ